MIFGHRTLLPFLPFLPSLLPHSLFLKLSSSEAYRKGEYMNIYKWTTVGETGVPDPESIYPASTYPLTVLVSMVLP